MKKNIYFENLDGLRFLCFLSVFFYHSFYTVNNEIKSSSVYHFIKTGVFGNGNIGVNFFFCIKWILNNIFAY
jgi:peptidoglycan/LPS O-acetylase OafA/YrhL